MLSTGIIFLQGKWINLGISPGASTGAPGAMGPWESEKPPGFNPSCSVDQFHGRFCEVEDVHIFFLWMKTSSKQGLVNVPFWVYWTSPDSSQLVDHIPNGWVMFNGDISWPMQNPFETKTETNIQQVTGIQVSQPWPITAQGPESDWATDFGTPWWEDTQHGSTLWAVKISETVQGEAPKPPIW